MPNQQGTSDPTFSELPTLALEPCPVLAPSPLRGLRDQAAVCPVRTPAGDEAWLVTRHAEMKELLRDERLGRSHPNPPAAPKYVKNPLVDMLILDDADAARERHAQIRALLTPQFSARRMHDLQPRVEAVAKAMVEGLAARERPADLHTHFSLPYSLYNLYELLGVPEDHRGRCAALLAGIGRVGGEGGDAAGAEAAGPDALFELLGEIAAAKRAEPADDVISRLTAAGIPDVKAGALAATLMFAGLESVASHIDLGVVLLATHAEQRDAALHDPAALAALVEEVLRSAKRSGSTFLRYASEDIDVAGVTIRSGDLVLIDFALANYDERVFERAEDFDATRSPNPHLAFGHGLWHCIGSSLARIELSTAFTTLFSRLPELRPAVPTNQLLAQNDQLVSGLAELPVTW